MRAGAFIAEDEKEIFTKSRKVRKVRAIPVALCHG
jgi:hypothetical protein